MAAFPNRSLSDLRRRKITANYVGSYRSAVTVRLARRLISAGGLKQLPGQNSNSLRCNAPKSRPAKRLIVCNLSVAKVIFYVSRTALPKPRAGAATPLGTVDCVEGEQAKASFSSLSRRHARQIRHKRHFRFN